MVTQKVASCGSTWQNNKSDGGKEKQIANWKTKSCCHGELMQLLPNILPKIKKNWSDYVDS